jgi:hypothetical protein
MRGSTPSTCSSTPAWRGLGDLLGEHVGREAGFR